MTKYVSRFGKIEAVEVERETTGSVWRGGRRRAKATDYECYHDTFDLAKQHIVNKARTAFSRAEEQLEYARMDLNEAMALKPTKP